METAAYRRLMTAWVTSNAGSSMDEALLAISPLPFTIFLCCATQKEIFLLDFLILVVPVILNFTFFSSNVYNVPIVLSQAALLCCALVKKTLPLAHILNSKTGLRPSWITNFRACTQLATVISIFAVDLNIFPRKFAKTEVDGFGAMDLGVGFYVVCSGLVYKKNPIRKEVSDFLILCGLGVIRLICMRLVGYHEHITEYGVHWNFFFTLAVCRLSIIVFIHWLEFDFIWLAVTFGTIHQTVLSSGVQDYVLSSSGRDNIIDANREGIASALGYITIFYTSIVFRNRIIFYSIQNQLRATFLIAFLSWIGTNISAKHFGVSRRLCNIGYIVWTVATASSLSVILILVDVGLLWIRRNRVPCLLATINRNGLLFFLLGNVATGIINLSIQTLLLSTMHSYLILIVYIFTILLIINYGLSITKICKSYCIK